MVECEWSNLDKQKDGEDVLIDTWWNVNQFRFAIKQCQYSSFNRYMVECEYLR